MSSDIEPAPEPAEPDPVEVLAQAHALESDRRRWVLTILPVIECCAGEAVQRDEAVQAALDSLVLTACARLKRILRSDLRS